MNSRISVLNVDVLPSVGLEPLLNILGEGDVGVSVDGDVVVVVDGDEVSELEVTVSRRTRIEDVEVSSSLKERRREESKETYPAREAASEATPSWRQPSPVNTAKAKERSAGVDGKRNEEVELTVGEVVNQREVLLVEGSSEVSLSDGESDGVGESLSEGSSGDLNTYQKPKQNRTEKSARTNERGEGAEGEKENEPSVM